MDRIQGYSQLLGILRTQVTTRVDQVRRGPTEKKNQRGVHTKTYAELEQSIIQRVRQLDRRGAEWELQARQIAVASILSWEFGDDLLNDPAFADMLVDVEKRLESNPNAAREMQRILAACQA